MQERQVCRSVNPAVHDVEQLSQLWMSDFKLSCTFRSTVWEYNVTSLAPSKIFLGIELDTIAMEARLPAEKLSRVHSSIHTWQGRKSCTKQELLSLIGDLQHASSVVTPGCTFLCRMIQTSTIGKKPYHHIHLGREFCSDLTWWYTFLES